jgi:hypothetical protein
MVHRHAKHLPSICGCTSPRTLPCGLSVVRANYEAGPRSS